MPAPDSPRRPTMRDIAEKTGVTVNTVSRALKDKPDISEATRQKIRQAAKELGYVPNSMASALRSGRSGTLALIIGDLGNPKFAAMANDIEAAARAKDYSVLILCTHEDPELERRAIRTALGRQVDGIILNPTQQDDRCLELLRAGHTPFVFIERSFPDPEVDSVVCDEEMGGYLACKHLLDQGHTKLLHLSGPGHVSSAVERWSGFLRAAQEHGVRDALVRPLRGGAQDIRTLRTYHKRGFTGVFYYFDMGAWDAMAGLQREDPALLRELSFVGFDNIQGKFSFPAPLCSVDSSSSQVCRATVELLDGRIQGGQQRPQQLVFPVQVVCRGSCRYAAAQKSSDF